MQNPFDGRSTVNASARMQKEIEGMQVGDTKFVKIGANSVQGFRGPLQAYERKSGKSFRTRMPIEDNLKKTGWWVVRIK